MELNNQIVEKFLESKVNNTGTSYYFLKGTLLKLLSQVENVFEDIWVNSLAVINFIGKKSLKSIYEDMFKFFRESKREQGDIFTEVLFLCLLYKMIGDEVTKEPYCFSKEAVEYLNNNEIFHRPLYEGLSIFSQTEKRESKNKKTLNTIEHRMGTELNNNYYQMVLFSFLELFFQKNIENFDNADKILKEIEKMLENFPHILDESEREKLEERIEKK